MNKQIALFLGLLISFNCSFAQLATEEVNNKMTNYEKIIDDFGQVANRNPLFSNGINATIEKPKNDKDALVKGFKTMHYDKEQDGGWEMLAAKNVIIRENYRAVLYIYKSKQFIALYKKWKDNKYYFRIYNASYYNK